MKLSIAVSFVLAALASANPFAPATSANSPKAEYISNLLRGARRLADNANNAANDNAVDLMGYNVVFSKCQFVKTFSDNMANSDADTVLTTERFVVFKLCSSCSSCSSSYGEYIIDLQTYLKYTIYYAEVMQQATCTACANTCTDTDDKGAAAENVGEDDKVEGNGRRAASSSNACSCVEECNFYQNLGSNGYYDAGDLVECVQIYQSEDGSETLYGGPVCGNYGSKIKIGVFTDNECRNYDSSKDIENYLKSQDGTSSSMKLSYNVLQQTYSTCINCTYVENDAAETRPVCQNLYGSSAKCESSSSSSSSSDSVVCNYINSVTSGTYSESGDITLSGISATMRSGAKTSGGQKFALTFFVLGTVGLAAYAAMLHSKLTKGGKADLTSQSGAMA